MIITRLFPLALLSLSLAPVRLAAQAVDTAAVLAAARPDIDAGNRDWVTGFRRRDAALIAAAYADSGVFIAPDATVTRGRSAIQQMYVARIPRLRTIRDGLVTPDGVTVATATTVYEWGHAWLEQEPPTPGGTPVRSGGAYLTVWQRQADGHWRIVRNLAL